MTTNYNHIEITFGNSLGKNIFDANIPGFVLQTKKIFEEIEESTTQY